MLHSFFVTSDKYMYPLSESKSSWLVSSYNKPNLLTSLVKWRNRISSKLLYLHRSQIEMFIWTLIRHRHFVATRRKHRKVEREWSFPFDTVRVVQHVRRQESNRRTKRHWKSFKAYHWHHWHHWQIIMVHLQF